MVGIATRVLRLAFAHAVADEVEPEDRRLDFAAYAAGSLLAGRIRLDADRLTDLLNATDEIELLDVICITLEGRVVETERATIRRSELLAVKAGEPRGSRAHRHRTRQTAVSVATGPYMITGYLHTRPGADPMTDVGRRPPMIPLTDASISYQVHSEWRREDASTVIVNRDVADWIRPARERDIIGRRGAA